MHNTGYVLDTRRKLPHKQLVDCVLFVTWRLAFDIPQHILQALQEQQQKVATEYETPQATKADIEATNESLVSSVERSLSDIISTDNDIPATKFIDRRFYLFDELIGRYNHHEHNLVDEPYRSIIKQVIMFDDKRKYDLYAFCVMSNHVHVVLKPLAVPITAPTSGEGERPVHSRGDCGYGIQSTSGRGDCGCVIAPASGAETDGQTSIKLEYAKITQITQDIKSITAHKINKALNRTGKIWMPETYDHIVRTEAELLKTLEYTFNNPVKAGLINKWERWNGTYLSPQFT